MIEPRDEELVNREIDGENTPEESAELRARVARLEDVRACYDGLFAVARTLDRVKSLAPPSELTREVMQRLRQAPSHAQTVSWLETLRAAFRRRPAFRYGLTFATGLALGALFLAFAGRSASLRWQDTSALSGTILPDGRLGRLETLDRAPLAGDGVQGEATIRMGSDFLLAEIEIDARRPVDLAVDFETGGVFPLAFERSGASDTDVVLGPRQLRLRHSGQGRYVLVLGGVGHGAPPPVRVTVTGEGLRLEKTLETRHEGS